MRYSIQNDTSVSANGVISIIIYVFSDSHKRISSMLGLISDCSPDAVIHLGDVDSDAGKISSAFPDIPLYAVSGNNDFFPSYPPFCVARFAGKKIFMTHGHLYGVRRGTGALAAAAEREGADIALFGHTHEKFSGRTGELVLLNPGSISLPRSGRPSFIRLEIAPGILSYKITEI